MARRRQPFAPFVGGTLKPIPELPEAATLRALDLPFTDTELTHIRTAMALHKASRQPQLTYDGWKVIGLALNIGEVRAKQHAKGVVHSRGPYGVAIALFLNATGFAFLNKGVRWALRQIISHLDEVDAWHEGLDPNDRAHLHNPQDCWERFVADQRNPKSRSKPRPVTMQRRGYPNYLEQLIALQDACEDAERRSEILETMLLDVIGAVPSETLQRLPDDLLRRIFSKLPEPIQDVLHRRLYGPAEETATQGSQDA